MNSPMVGQRQSLAHGPIPSDPLVTSPVPTSCAASSLQIPMAHVQLSGPVGPTGVDVAVDPTVAALSGRVQACDGGVLQVDPMAQSDLAHGLPASLIQPMGNQAGQASCMLPSTEDAIGPQGADVALPAYLHARDTACASGTEGEAFPSTAGVAMDGDLAHGHDPPGLDPLGPQGTHFRRFAAYMRGRRTATLHRHFWMWRATHALEAFDRSLQHLRAQGGPKELPV